MRGRTWRIAATLVLTVGGLAPPPARAAAPRVELANLRFTPARLEVAVGDTVLWTSRDAGHTVTARDDTFDSSPRGLMGDGDEYRYRFRVPGAYPYFCRVQQSRGMQGEIVVVDPSATTATTTRAVPTTATASTPSAGATTTTAPPATTSSRPLATSSTTSMSVATATTSPPGTPAEPQEPPALNPAARLVGSPIPDASLDETRAAARRSDGSGPAREVAAGLGLLVVLGAAGGGALLRARRRRPV